MKSFLDIPRWKLLFKSWKALFLYAFGDENRAVHKLEECLEIDPNNAPNLISLGKILVGKEKYSEGLGKFEMALKEMKPNDSSLPEVLAYIAHCHHKLGSLDFAVPFYERAIDSWTRDGAFNKSDMIYGLGRIFLKKKKYEKAIKVLNEAVSTQNINPLIHLGLGVAYYGTGQNEEGKYHIDIAQKLNPQLTNDETLKKLIKDLDGKISIH